MEQAQVLPFIHHIHHTLWCCAEARANQHCKCMMHLQEQELIKKSEISVHYTVINLCLYKTEKTFEFTKMFLYLIFSYIQ